VLTGGWFALRHSPLASVQHVRVSGVHGPDAGAIEAALVAAGRRMSTLDVRPAALRTAVAGFPVVREVRATASFPHGLRVRVIEQPPVAALTVGSARTAVAADGVVLGPALLTGSLPTLSGSYQPAPGKRLSDRTLLGSLAVLGAAPAPLARLLARVFSGPKGLTIAMRSGLLAYFGDASRPHAKWLSLARVLADSSSAGASYVDVRLPERPAAGFPPGVAPPASTTSQTEQASSAESTVAALAAGLSGPGAAASGEASSQGSATSSHSASEAPSPAPAEGASAEHGEASEGPPTAGG
jgi:cell division protein FtsQ